MHNLISQMAFRMAAIGAIGFPSPPIPALPRLRLATGLRDNTPDPNACALGIDNKVSHTGGRVLIVDDEIGQIKICKAAFRNAPFHTEYAISGEEAHGLWRSKCHTPDAYDLIVLDVVMPGLNGLQTAEKMRQHDDCAVKLIFWTGDESPLVDMRAHRVQAIMVLPKVIDIRALQSFICTALYGKSDAIPEGETSKPIS